MVAKGFDMIELQANTFRSWKEETTFEPHPEPVYARTAAANRIIECWIPSLFVGMYDDAVPLIREMFAWMDGYGPPSGTEYVPSHYASTAHNRAWSWWNA